MNKERKRERETGRVRERTGKNIKEERERETGRVREQVKI